MFGTPSEKLQSALEVSAVAPRKKTANPQKKIDAVKKALKKNNDEADHLDRFILSNKRFLPNDEPVGILSPSPEQGVTPPDSLDAVLAEATPESQDSTMTATPTQLQDSSQQSPRNLLISESDTACTPGMEASAIDTSTSSTAHVSDSPSSVNADIQNESDLGEIFLGGVG